MPVGLALLGLEVWVLKKLVLDDPTSPATRLASNGRGA